MAHSPKHLEPWGIPSSIPGYTTYPQLHRGIAAAGTSNGMKNSLQEKLGCMKSSGTADMLSPYPAKGLHRRITAKSIFKPVAGGRGATPFAVLGAKAEHRAHAADTGTQR